MSAIHAYAARAPKGPLQAFEFDPGGLMPDEVEIKVTHCGICHSDLSMLENEWGMSQFPLVPGHEAIGTVLTLGKNAKGLQVGQRVGVGWSASSCLHCRECLSGHHTHYENDNKCNRPNKELVFAGIKGVFIDRDPAVLDRLFSDDYQQHNPQIPNGTAAIKALLRNLPADFKYEPGLVVADGDYVTIHGRYIGWGPKPMVAVDIFRVANGKIAEHWDVMQEEVPAAQSANGNSMLTTQE